MFRPIRFEWAAWTALFGCLLGLSLAFQTDVWPETAGIPAAAMQWALAITAGLCGLRFAISLLDLDWLLDEPGAYQRLLTITPTFIAVMTAHISGVLAMALGAGFAALGREVGLWLSYELPLMLELPALMLSTLLFGIVTGVMLFTGAVIAGLPKAVYLADRLGLDPPELPSLIQALQEVRPNVQR